MHQDSTSSRFSESLRAYCVNCITQSGPLGQTPFFTLELAARVYVEQNKYWEKGGKFGMQGFCASFFRAVMNVAAPAGDQFFGTEKYTCSVCVLFN